MRTRREFLRWLATLTGGLAAACRAGPGAPPEVPAREGNPSLFTGRDESLVVVVEGHELDVMLTAGLEVFPGFDAALRAASSIVLKPNATTRQPYPVTTDLQLLRNLTEIVVARAPAHVTVCDSSSFAGLTAWRIFNELGYNDLRRPGVAVRSVDPTVGSWFARVSRASWSLEPALLVNRTVVEADLVINLAIPKRHHAAGMTCALKNNMGCIYETFRALAHLRLAADGQAGFDRALAQFADAVRPELTIVDARSLLARHGPAYAEGRSQIVPGVDRLILSNDMVAVDNYCAELLEEYDPTFSAEARVERQLMFAEELGLGRRSGPRVRRVELTA